jgi:hypothetical protein
MVHADLQTVSLVVKVLEIAATEIMSADLYLRTVELDGKFAVFPTLE